MAQVVMLVHEENGRFGASFPDFPGCITVADNIDALIGKAGEALAFHIAGIVEDGQLLPSIRSLTELRADPRYQEDAHGAVVVFLSIDLPGRVVRVNITLDENILDLINRTAESTGETRSRFLVESAKERIARIQAGKTREMESA